MSTPSTPYVRLDKWLWAARFYKTRTLAVEAIHGGHVKLNGLRAKAGTRVQIGDRLIIRKQPMTFDITVRDLSERRGPSGTAQQLYEEDADSRARRETEQAIRREQARLNPRPRRKPDKRERRKIIRFVNKYSQENP